MRSGFNYLATFLWLGSLVGGNAEPKPTIAALKLEPGERLKVDGVLEEEAWQRAAKGGGFRQYDPGRGTPATERTEFAIAYDLDHLYVAVW